MTERTDEPSFADPNRLADTDEAIDVIDPAAGEQPEVERFVNRTIDLLHSAQFIDRFTGIHTIAEMMALKAAEDRLRSIANKLAKLKIQRFAAAKLGLEVADASRLGQQWHEAVMETGRATSETTDGLPLKDFLLTGLLPVVASSEEYTSQLQTAEEALAQAVESIKQSLINLLAELDARRNDPALLEAAAMWANSPDSQDNRGEDGLGYNAGIIHFFEYRSAIEKRRRFRHIEEPVTADGFIAFSNRLYRELVSPFQSGVNRVVILEDEAGSRRHYVLCPNSELIVGFQRPGEAAPRMTSMISLATDAYLDKAVAECLRGDDRGRLNKLGPQVTQIV